jgi:Protein of unknown function (DUF4019)
MKLISSLFLALATVVSVPSNAQESEAIAQAKIAASAWLALVDAGNYSGSWEQAAELFRSAVTEPSWESAVRAARTPLGALKSRELVSSTFTHQLPGAPDGEYVVLKYASKFAGNAAAVETITPLKEKNGSWHVSGYFVR